MILAHNSTIYGGTCCPIFFTIAMYMSLKGGDKNKNEKYQKLYSRLHSKIYARDCYNVRRNYCNGERLCKLSNRPRHSCFSLYKRNVRTSNQAGRRNIGVAQIHWENNRDSPKRQDNTCSLPDPLGIKIQIRLVEQIPRAFFYPKIQGLM